MVPDPVNVVAHSSYLQQYHAQHEFMVRWRRLLVDCKCDPVADTVEFAASVAVIDTARGGANVPSVVLVRGE